MFGHALVKIMDTLIGNLYSGPILQAHYYWDQFSSLSTTIYYMKENLSEQNSPSYCVYIYRDCYVII